VKIAVLSCGCKSDGINGCLWTGDLRTIQTADGLPEDGGTYLIRV